MEGDLINRVQASKERCVSAVERGDRETLRSLMETLPVEDFALLIGTFSDPDLLTLADLTNDFFDFEILLDLGAHQKHVLIKALNVPERLGEVKDWETDDIMDLMDSMSWEDKQRALAACAPKDRNILAMMSSYPEETAARMLQRSMVVVSAVWRVEEAIHHIQEADDIPEEFHEVYVVNLQNHLVGAVHVGTLLRADKKKLLQDLAEDVPRISAGMPQEEVVYNFRHYNLLTAPVESIDGQLIGTVSADDVLSIADEEAGEDLLKLSGVSRSDETEPLRVQALHRIIWLTVVVVNALMSAFVIEHFHKTIERKGVLAALMTIVSAIGGAAGTQVLAVSIRGLSLRIFQAKGVGPIFAREVTINFLGALIFGTMLALITYLWLGEVNLAITVFASLIFSMCFAAVCGVCLPWAIHSLGFDPTVSAAPLVGAFCDIAGFSLFLWIASKMLMG